MCHNIVQSSAVEPCPAHRYLISCSVKVDIILLSGTNCIVQVAKSLISIGCVQLQAVVKNLKKAHAALGKL